MSFLTIRAHDETAQKRPRGVDEENPREAAVIEGTFLALTGMSQYRSSDPEWLQKKQAGFGEAFKLVEESGPMRQRRF